VIMILGALHEVCEGARRGVQICPAGERKSSAQRDNVCEREAQLLLFGVKFPSALVLFS
jgi:hypothetical protein